MDFYSDSLFLEVFLHVRFKGLRGLFSEFNGIYWHHKKLPTFFLTEEKDFLPFPQKGI